jgi:hypothetical protein
MHQDADSPRLDGSASAGELSLAEDVLSPDRSFFGKVRMIPAALWSSRVTPIQTYYGGDKTFEVRIGDTAGTAFSVWTDCDGIDAMIDALLALKVGADHAWEMKS